MGEINREDMLELTRRMTLKRNCFSRAAGAYLDEEGFIDGTFNIHFQKLSAKEQQRNLDIAKTVPFAGTNVNLKEYKFERSSQKEDNVCKILTALNACGLKNDALLDVFYEKIGENYKADGNYGIYIYYGSYDIPLKVQDKENLWESEEVYDFLICVICPVSGDYEAGEPECGFLFPAFKDRSSDRNRINIFQKDEHHPHKEFVKLVLH